MTAPAHTRVALPSQRATSLPTLVLVGLCALTAALALLPSFRRIVELWSLSSYRHCVLLVPVVAYLVFERRARLRSVAIAPSGIGMLLLATCCLSWFVARGSGVDALEHLCAVAAFPAAVWAVCGTSVARALRFPLALSLALAPVGEETLPQLMESTATISGALLHLVGVPVLREGMYFTLPGGDFEVAEVCAGLRYLLAGTVFAAILANRSFASVRRQIAFVLVAAILFIVGNGVRAFIVMYVASASDMRYFAGYDHVVFGMVFFAAIAAGMAWYASRSGDVVATAATNPVADPLAHLDAPRVPWAGAGVAVTCLVVTRIAAEALDSSASSVSRAAIGEIPGCVASGTTSTTAASWQVRRYECDGGAISLTVAPVRDGSREGVVSSSALLPATFLQRADRSAERTPLPLTRYRSAAGADVQVAWTWYCIANAPVGGALALKARQVAAMLSLQRPPVTAFALAGRASSADETELERSFAAAAQNVTRAGGCS